jgi:hypothetical protein
MVNNFFLVLWSGISAQTLFKLTGMKNKMKYIYMKGKYISQTHIIVIRQL